MPRLPRTVCANLPYHVTQRGNRRERVFFDDADRLAYLGWLQDYTRRYAVDVLAYCLMDNHVHLVIVPATREGLHRVLKPVHMRHAQRINRRRGWKGHLWQGRFFSSALDETHLWAAIRYVERNPVRAKLIDRAERYRWSSAGAHCGLWGDPVLTASPSWRRQFDARGDWSAWLAIGDDPCSLEMFRVHAQRGLPCGSASFIDRLEAETGRVLRCRPPGRPRKGTLPDSASRKG